MGKTNSWKAFGSKYLKAENVADNTEKYVITKVDSEDEEGKETLILTVERNSVSKLFGCNATNEQAVKEACPNNPDQALSRIVVFNKVQAKNPSTKQMVDALRIQFVEEVEEEPKIDDSGINDDSTM